MSHTYATLEVSAAAYDEIAAKLRQAEYTHAFDGEVIDMHGIGLERGAAIEPPITHRESIWLTLRAELHPLTVNLVVRFARALAKKLADAEKKYGYGDGWRSPDWMDECRAKLREHIDKGDPRDVAAYCAFLWHHGASTAERNRE